MSAWAASRLIGAALDLRHRLPQLWAKTRAGLVRPWIARKAAETSRDLNPDLMGRLDGQLARWAPTLSWGRIDALIAAFVIEADPDAAAKAAHDAEQPQGVWLSRGSECGIKDIYIRTETPNAIWFDASIERIADQLTALGDTTNHNIRRAAPSASSPNPNKRGSCFGRRAPKSPAPPLRRRWTHGRQPPCMCTSASRPSPPPSPGRRSMPMRSLSGSAKPSTYATPSTSSPMPPAPADAATSTTPSPTNHPTTAAHPHKPASTTSPMTRWHHRVKTHNRWQVRQPFPGMFVWRSPHGRYHLVDHTGTHTTHTAA